MQDHKKDREIRVLTLPAIRCKASSSIHQPWSSNRLKEDFEKTRKRTFLHIFEHEWPREVQETPSAFRGYPSGQNLQVRQDSQDSRKCPTEMKVTHGKYRTESAPQGRKYRLESASQGQKCCTGSTQQDESTNTSIFGDTNEQP